MEDMSAVPSDQSASTEVRGTPETDAAALYAEIIVDLARKLERQRNALAEALRELLTYELRDGDHQYSTVDYHAVLEQARAALSSL